MSFASEFGHDIPPDDWNGGYSRGYKRGSRRDYSNNFTGDNPIFRTVNKKFDKLVHETEKAYLLEFAQGKTWLPKSQVSIEAEDKVVYLPAWLLMNLKFIQ